MTSMLALLISYMFSAATPFTSVKVKLHEAATLHCNHTCSGLVTWTVSRKPRDILAQCDQTSCQSEEGFHMSNDQYLKGDLSLTITDVDYSKRTWYTCECDGEEICDVSLQIDAVHVNKTVIPGESLSIDVPVSDPVEVTLNRTGDTKPNTVRLCEIKGRESQCDPEYEKRASFNSSLQLKDLNESDSGVYTIRDTRNDDIIVTYTVTVGVLQQESLNRDLRVKLHDAATLRCNHTCSGLVTWTVFHQPRDILAQCDQTSCQSEEGFRMSHDQYLKGDLSLTITDVDYSKRNLYICECVGVQICNVSLQNKAKSSKVIVLPGGSLTLDVPISEPVELHFNKTDHDHTNTVTLCQIRGRESQCDPEYKKRVSFNSSLQLKDLNESDSGVYIIRDTRNEEVIATYTVTVGGIKEKRVTHMSQTLVAVLSLVSVVIVVFVVVVVVVVVKNRLQQRHGLQAIHYQAARQG